MRLRQSAALTAAAVTALIAVPPAAVAADDPAGTLHVNNRSTTCTDAGSGTAGQPFCTISAAARAAQPGQTVQVVPGSYAETVLITGSGTPDKPITFVGTAGTDRTAVHPVTGAKSAVVLSGVHDVVVRGFSLYSNDSAGNTAPLVSAVDSSRVVLDRIRYAGGAGSGAVRLAGAGDHITVSRSVFAASGGLRVGAGVHDSLITANEFNETASAAVSAVDAPNTAVTGNSIAFSCEESVRIDGASPGAVVENNVITAQYQGETGWNSACARTPDKRGETEVSVSAGSVAGSKVDYNTVHPWSDASAYTWGGTSYRTAAGFAAAQPGQAAHDTDYDVPFNRDYTKPLVLPESATAAIDSADPDAPGVDTDLLGVRPTDDPAVAGTAPNGGVRDRGAYELTGQTSVGVQLSADVPTLQGPAPFTVQVTAKPVNTFGLAQADYLFDFGDGTDPVRSTRPTVTHTFTKPGNYYAVKVTATDVQGGQVQGTSNVPLLVKEPGDVTAALETPIDGALRIQVTTRAASPYAISKVDVDFGDGSRTATAPGAVAYHQYAAPGNYTVTGTVTDEGGRTAVVKKTVTVASGGYTQSLQPGSRVQVVGVPTSGPLYSTGVNYGNGGWQPWLPVPQAGAGFTADQVSSLASATTADQYLRVFALVGGKVYGADRNLGPAAGGLGQGQWTPWKEVTGPGPLVGVTQLSAASIGNSTHLVAVAGGRVYEASGDRAAGVWSKWGDITAEVGLPTGVAGIAAGTTDNVLHVAVLGADGHLRVADGDYTRGRWSAGDVTAGYGGPGNIVQVAAASTPGSRFHVVALTGQGRVHEITGDYAAGYWTGWGDISGASGLDPVRQVAAASTGNTIRLFAAAPGYIVYTVTGDYTAGRWSSASNVYDTAGSTSGINVLTAAGL
ncbi:PKD domain-containing protein [Kitasatospora cineracea]|uniref:PKD domain-containing protein n=1 Tax=Kitasatospora cineracea TaxID=88074 RepID=A0A8G1UIF7_9ACTN|nr:PKD domain-containing protein [Kitasatospora cineracea]ROR44488.1 PKD domain-containing protein [Kitasatospora cineracea]